MDNGDPRFPSSRFLRVACVIVPKGSPPPSEWLAAHPRYLRVSGFFTPRPPPEPNMGLEPQPESEGQTEPLPKKPTYRVEIDYAGNWIIKGVTVMMPQPAPRTEPPPARPQEPEPEHWQRPPTPAYPLPGPTSHTRHPEPASPRSWPYEISEAEADRLFQASCQAGLEAEKSPEVPARTDQRPAVLDAAVVAKLPAAGAMSQGCQPEPPAPPPWPPGISKPKADRLFAVGYRAGRDAPKSPASSARTDQLIKVVGGAIIAQARADGALEDVAGAAALVMDPLVDVSILGALAALGVVVAGEEVARILTPEDARPSVTELSPGLVFRGFRPPPPRPPLPGLVPPPVSQTKPGEGGFTPSPPSVPVHPGRPVEANKPIVLQAKKPPLPPAKADSLGVRRYDPNVRRHKVAAAAEKRLAHEVHGTPDEQVVEWGGPIGSHGADVVSVDTKTGRVTLWDAKYRSGRLKIDKSGKPERKDVKITASSTFKAGSRARANAIQKAEEAIEKDKTLPPAIRAKALANLRALRIRTITKGFGKAKNQVIGN